MEQGLRERHKAARRQAISDAATRLFEARGFEAVSLAEIAAEADVSIKTIWNHFGSKEDLFFDAEDAVLDLLAATVRSRDPGTSPTSALRPLIDAPILAGPCTWRDLNGPLYDGIRAYAACELASPALRARRLAIIHSWAPPLAAAAESPAWAAMLAGLLVFRHELVTTAIVDRLPPATVTRRVRAQLRLALDALDRAFAT